MAEGQAGVWAVCAGAVRHSEALGLPSLFRDQRARGSSSGWYDAPPGAVDTTPRGDCPLNSAGGAHTRKVSGGRRGSRHNKGGDGLQGRGPRGALGKGRVGWMGNTPHARNTYSSVVVLRVK